MLIGGDGDDRIGGGEGKDYTAYPDAPNGIIADLGARTVTGEGTDRLDQIERVRGSEFDDTITGDAGSNRLVGRGGNDELKGGGDVDILEGGPDDDSLDGGPDNDVAVHFDSTDAVNVNLATGVVTGEGTDELTAVEGATGSANNDIVTGDGEDNILFGGEGDDEVIGGGGFDHTAFWFADGPVVADLTTGTATGEGDDTLSEIDGLLGSEFDDHLAGDGADNHLDGDEGNDELDGDAGDDLFVGGLGDDDIDGGAGTYDRVDFRSEDRLKLDLAAGTATGDGDDVLAGIEGAAAGGGRDKLQGNGKANYLVGNEGPDVIKGGGGGDFLNGGGGDDEGDGGSGNDSCRKFEEKVSCEGTTEPEEHPVEDETGAAETLRRNF